MKGAAISLRQGGLHAGLALGGLFVALPFLWMIILSFTPEDQIYASGLFAGITFDNYIFVWNNTDLLRYYLNSIVVASVTLILQLLVCVPAAFALARLRFRGSGASLWLVLACLMVPPQATAIPVYIFLARLGLLDTRTALIIPFIASAFGVFLMRQFFLTIHESLFDAAKMDGARTLQTIWNVLVPAGKPAIIAFSVFSFVYHWNDFFWPSLVLRTENAATVPFGVAAFVDVEAGRLVGAQMAAAVLAVVPILALFFLLQRQFIEGLSLGGVQD